MKTLGVIVLGLLAIASGGCSLMFTPMYFDSSSWSYFGPESFLLWLGGIAIAGLSVWGILRMTR